MVGSDNGQGPQSRQSKSQQARRNPRLRLACLRCQRRKIRCDGDLPSCRNCKSAGAECTDGESARLRDLPRAYITNLKRRISWLETIVRTRCPDVDLAQGQPLDLSDEGQNDEGIDNTTQLMAGSPTPPATQEYIGPLSDTQPLTSPAPVRTGPGTLTTGASALSHEIGLVSLGTNQDPRYIGPSSGYFLARVMLNSTSKQDDRLSRTARDAPFPTQLVEASQGPLPLPPRDVANQISDAYFEVIHPQYPILHQPTFKNMLDQIYEHDSQDPAARFQVFTVLAIGSTVLCGRLKARIPGESYFLSALPYFNNLNLENSLQGVQCLILTLIFTIHSPYVRLNVWYLNYHCLAALLDLGLQRDINTRSGISLLEQEMRTRIFWVIFSMDRVIATMMGRPIGIRDEACELRMPQGLNDEILAYPAMSGTDMVIGDPSQMQFALHLFQAAKLNSEIKYVANSVNRSTPSYAYPSIIDINEWQSSMLQKLDQWAAEIPGDAIDPTTQYLRSTCLLRYRGLQMLLLRPSPAIPKPSHEMLEKCHNAACDSIRLFDNLYRKNLLVHTWMTFHSLVLSTITMLYCIKVVPEIARKTEADVLMGDLSVALSVLSATGEHWSGAKRSRDILDELGRSTVRWLREPTQTRTRGDVAMQGEIDRQTASIPSAGTLPYIPGDPTTFDSFNGIGINGSSGAFDNFLVGGSFAEYFDTNDSINVDDIVRDLFQDFIPPYPAFT